MVYHQYGKTPKEPFIIVSGTSKKDAYKDQFGIAHRGWIVKQYRIVQVVETKKVPGTQNPTSS